MFTLAGVNPAGVNLTGVNPTGVNLAGVKAFINFLVTLFFPSLDLTLTYGLIQDAIEELLHRRRTPLGRSASSDCFLKSSGEIVRSNTNGNSRI